MFIELRSLLNDSKQCFQVEIQISPVYEHKFNQICVQILIQVSMRHRKTERGQGYISLDLFIARLELAIYLSRFVLTTSCHLSLRSH